MNRTQEKIPTLPKMIFFLLIIITIDSFLSFHLKAASKDPWNVWLKEVAPIMTSLESTVAKKIKTEEDRGRFKELFWKARDTNPETPGNEFQTEYYQRRAYAENFLNGVDSDRGRIYILLGKPDEKTDFVGHQSLVECQLWSYETKERPGLPPFMYFVFFKPHDVGDFQLYHPGINSPRDLLAPQLYDDIKNNLQAYKQIKYNSTALASASLSIIPGEGDPTASMSLSSSNFILNNVYSLPEREAEAGYVRDFVKLAGSVQVDQSTNIIRGYGYISVTRIKGIPFIHYALLPDTLHFKQTAPTLYEADVLLLLSIETTTGSIVFQDSKPVHLEVDIKKKQRIADQRIVFRHFTPIIDGEFKVTLTYMNKTTDEFFTYEQSISISPSNITAIIGFQQKEDPSGNYMPFTADQIRISTDPRFLFNQKDTLEGIIQAGTPPIVQLEKNDDKSIIYPVEIVPFPTPALNSNDQYYILKKTLSGIKDGNYSLLIKNPTTGQIISTPIHLLPFYIDIKRPFGMEHPEPPTAILNYSFIRGQQYLALGKTDEAIRCFEQVPTDRWKPEAIPVIARAYYLKENYTKVLELLDREEINKEYPILVMLANSAIGTKTYSKAVTWLEKLLNYENSAEINELLGSTYLIMKNQKKAAIYYGRAREIKNKSKSEKKEKNNHE